MPNHVRNVLKFNNLTPGKRQFILTMFTSDIPGEDVYPLNKVFDFNGIIPEPKTEDECPEDCKVNKDSHIREDEDRPWYDWYTWRNKYWGTKWGAYDGYTKIGKTTITFVFSTAWSAPHPIFKQLVKDYPDLTWEVRYADEDIGSNCAKIIYNPERTGFTDAVIIPEEDLHDPDEFARRIWRNY